MYNHHESSDRVTIHTQNGQERHVYERRSLYQWLDGRPSSRPSRRDTPIGVPLTFTPLTKVERDTEVERSEGEPNDLRSKVPWTV